jgi:uncharacterized phage protein (predicted DNA packaging)
MPLINDLKTVMRISGTAFDTELDDLIAAAQSDLSLSGVTQEKVNDDTDPLIRRAVFTYVKANFGWDNPDSEKLQQSYDMLKRHLTLSQEYSLFTVTFTVTDGVNPLEDAIVSFDGEEIFTNVNGNAVFTGVKAEQNKVYKVTLSGYNDSEGKIDISGSTTVSVTMEAS